MANFYPCSVSLLGFYQKETEAGYGRRGEEEFGIVIPFSASLSCCYKLMVFVSETQGCAAASLYTTLWIPISLFPIVPSALHVILTSSIALGCCPQLKDLHRIHF